MQTDIPLKRLTEICARDFLPLLGAAGVEVVRVETLELEQGAPDPQRANLLTILGVFAEPLVGRDPFVRLIGREQLMASDLRSYLIRPLAVGDIAAVDALAREMRRWFSPSDLRDIAALLRDAPSGWLSVDVGGTLIGFLLDAPTADPAVREIAWMAVREAWQGRGAGSMLLERMEGAATAEGTRALEVSTVAASAGYAPYEATRAFYHRRGFVDVRVDLDYYWPGGDRLVLRKALVRGTTP